MTQSNSWFCSVCRESWWRRRSHLERLLSGTVLALIALCLLLVIGVAFLSGAGETVDSASTLYLYLSLFFCLLASPSREIGRRFGTERRITHGKPITICTPDHWQYQSLAEERRIVTAKWCKSTLSKKIFLPFFL